MQVGGTETQEGSSPAGLKWLKAETRNGHAWPMKDIRQSGVGKTGGRMREDSFVSPSEQETPSGYAFPESREKRF